MLVALVWVYHVGSIPTGGINRYDEFYTLDRSASFARQGDWLSVYSRNEVTFKKPPLQYWMSALLLESGIEQAVALRLPSMLFALGTLLSTALLAAAIVPQYPWSMPLSVLLGASSNQFWENATSAMLDSGTAFFATLALATAILALRRPVWWYAVAVAIGLGALQKAPIGLLLVALYILFLSLTRTRHGFSYKELKRQPQFRRSLLIAIIATLAWPVLQTLMHGTGALDEFFREQMVRRFAPEPFEELRRLATLEELDHLRRTVPALVGHPCPLLVAMATWSTGPVASTGNLLRLFGRDVSGRRKRLSKIHAHLPADAECRACSGRSNARALAMARNRHRRGCLDCRRRPF